ncbi:MAG: hypothetical protein ABEK36_01205 [Candidatus Aenigmatarchaeota archaeon]
MKGGIDPTALAGMFITLLMFWAISGPLITVVNGIANTFGGVTADIITYLPFMIVLAILATFWSYQKVE